MPRVQDYTEWFEWEAGRKKTHRAAVQTVRVLVEGLLHARRDALVPAGRVAGRRVVLHPSGIGEPLFFSLCRKHMTRPVFQDWTNVCLCTEMATRGRDGTRYTRMDPAVYDLRWVPAVDAATRRRCFEEARRVRDVLETVVDGAALQRDLDFALAKHPEVGRVFESVILGGDVPAGYRGNRAHSFDMLCWNRMDGQVERDTHHYELHAAPRSLLKVFCVESVKTPGTVLSKVELRVLCRLRRARECVVVDLELHRTSWAGPASPLASLRPHVTEYLYDTHRVLALDLRGNMLFSLALDILPFESDPPHRAVVFALLAVMEDTLPEEAERRLHALDAWSAASDAPAPHPVLDELRRGVRRVYAELRRAESADRSRVRWRLVNPRARAVVHCDAPYSPTAKCGHADAVGFADGVFARPSVAFLRNVAYVYRRMVDCLIASHVIRRRSPVGVVSFISPNVLEEV